jgi:hypothetical protein
MTIKIRRQWNDWRIASVDHENIDTLHWDDLSGGVRGRAPSMFIHGYTWCDQVKGEIAHSCQHGPAPHRIKVCIVKKDNLEIWNKLIEMVGPRPNVRLSQFNSKAEADQIVEAICTGGTHRCVMNVKGLIVVSARRASPSFTPMQTLAGRSKRLRRRITALMEAYPEFAPTKYRSMLAYRRRSPSQMVNTNHASAT